MRSNKLAAKDATVAERTAVGGVKENSLLNKRARLWNSAELLVLVLSEAVLAIEKDGKSRAN